MIQGMEMLYSHYILHCLGSNNKEIQDNFSKIPTIRVCLVKSNGGCLYFLGLLLLIRFIKIPLTGLLQSNFVPTALHPTSPQSYVFSSPTIF